MVGKQEVVGMNASGAVPLIPFHALRALRSVLSDPFEGPCRFSCGYCFICILHEHLQKHRLHKAHGHAAANVG